MAKAKPSVPEILPTSPISLICPLCKAKPDHDCVTDIGEFSAIHIARINAAVSIGRAIKRKGS
jgi:hypothetical protein